MFRNPRTGGSIAIGCRTAARRLSIAAPIAQGDSEHFGPAGRHHGRSRPGEFQSEWVEPISTDYRGWKVYELPPNGQGMATLEMLNIMERFPLGDISTCPAWRLFIWKMEAQKLAYADLQRYLGRSALREGSGAGLLSKDYAAERAALIDWRESALRSEAGQPERVRGRYYLPLGGRP